MAFLPATREEMETRGWEQPDFVLVTGDAYVDHPSFGAAIIGRVLESRGYRVAVLAQPDWRTAEEFRRFGRPRLGFLVGSGNVDSMVNHFSVFRQRRRSDSYSPGGQTGRRPDRALIVYANRAREAYKGVPVIIGGLEASLRRFAHYDYWDDKVRRSILLDSKADLLVYGMGERASLEIAEALDAGIAVGDITYVRGTVWRQTEKKSGEAGFPEGLLLPSYEEICRSRQACAQSFRLQYENSDHITAETLIEPYGGGVLAVQNPPAEPLSSQELDDVYELPYERAWHPMYDGEGGVPALEEVKFSLTANRGCYGGCAFCALTYHQGRQVRSRSKESLLREGEVLTRQKDFKGYIHDVGGPTANFRGPACKKQEKAGVCKDRDCLFPSPCPNLKADHREYLDILKALRELPGVKKVFIRSGLRYDYILADPRGGEFLEALCRHHVSGTLKVAPEHVAPGALAVMRKPPKEVFAAFAGKYREINRRLGKEQYLIPYMISSHPGTTLEDGVELALFLKKAGFVPDQVQDFYPTPGTLATCMYYTGLDPLTGKEVYVARTMEEKKLQRALLHFHKEENRETVKKALEKAGRPELMKTLTGGGPGRRKGGRP
ncbi:MAG: YgiQ family radical SAM protein [Bacillota bacterium]|nr:YgiQ family radical SAM protein [Bacillota bacterium]